MFLPMIIIANNIISKEIIDGFMATNEVIIDGKWTKSDEWNDGIEETLYFGNGSGKAYLRLKHDIENLYVLIDFLSYNEIKIGDGCLVVVDTKHDGGSSVQSDDLATVIRWNAPTEIYTAIQWGGWWTEWESLPIDFEVSSSTDAEQDPYSTTPHLIFEFKIPKSRLALSSSTLGFLTFLICDDENLSAFLPLIQKEQEVIKPDNWADLILFNDSIQIYYNAQTAIDEANNAIRDANLEGRTEGLSQAETLFTHAGDAFDIHDYDESIKLSNQASETAEKAIPPSKSSDKDKDTPGFELIFVLSAIAFIYLWKRKK
jgi:hypothetical protein